MIVALLAPSECHQDAIAVRIWPKFVRSTRCGKLSDCAKIAGIAIHRLRAFTWSDAGSALFVHESRLERYPALKDMTENSPRKHPRYASEGRVTVTVQRPEGKLSFWGIVANLSQNGLASTVVGNLTLGEILTLRFSPLPGYPELQIRARVSHQKGYYCGFEFLWLNDIDRQSLEKACSELSRT